MSDNIIFYSLFLSSFICMFGILFTLFIYHYAIYTEYEYIWFCSKILTVKKMVKIINNKKSYAFAYYYNNSYY